MKSIRKNKKAYKKYKGVKKDFKTMERVWQYEKYLAFLMADELEKNINWE